ncbi:hypothetical protein PYW08_010300 [Mythimna loreyi]|uniref:Uncharacterized protein n=1 Tax=Mythimna loreyi TaxID=667449 RepID=A0ACC2Q501_9NEOP|nr:hypothetical protein PYW08_010300 [Mythimna loreyi]
MFILHLSSKDEEKMEKGSNIYPAHSCSFESRWLKLCRKTSFRKLGKVTLLSYKMGASLSNQLLTAAQIPFTMLTTLGLDKTLWPKQAIIENNTMHDYIIVGGGTAGCVVARRLAESGRDSVMLLEEGGDPPFLAMIAYFFDELPNSPIDRNYTSTRDPYAARGQNNYTKLTSGITLGGSASLNHFIHLRGSRLDYNDWAKITGDDSWNYENVLPYFKKSENVCEDDKILKKNCKYHGTNGPIGLTRQPEKKLAGVLKAFAEVGNPTVLDLNANKDVGYTEPQYTLAKSLRQTPGYVYLKTVKDKPNFHVSKHTKVTRIIFEGNVAVAVEAMYKGKMYVFRARKEIIISAGVFNTPQLLMLSGIGPRNHLESFNIKVLKDLPVGENLIDHVSVTLIHKLKEYPVAFPDIFAEIPYLVKYPLPTLAGSVAFDKSQDYPDYHVLNWFLRHDLPYLTLICERIFGMRNDICERWQKQVTKRVAMYSILSNVQPKSRGTVRLRSKNPYADPVIKTGFYTNRDDLRTMVKIIKDFLAVDGTEYFRKLDSEVAGLDLPECAGEKKGTDKFWECYIKEHTHSRYHSVGTCPMGKVVDSKLRVLGVKKLRVVDASVMPEIPCAPPNAAVIMVAEKASDIIKKDNRNV